jgi:glutaredoxin
MTTRFSFLLLAPLALALASTAVAQYRYVAPDGRVTYSDQPPPPSEKVVSQRKLNETTAPVTPLPFEVAQATSRYPVTLYTGEKCPPCEEARTYLRGRGVPFTEKTVTSEDDIALFRQQSPDGTAPVMAIGGRKTIGFAQTTWAALLDGAGYPQTNTLPRDYQNPIPTALSPSTRSQTQAIAGAPPAKAQTRSTPPASPAPASTAPTTSPGFRF